MKKIISFSAIQSNSEVKPIQYKEIPNGVEFDMVIFSTAYNRNKAYFQVSKLLKWQNKLERIMFDFNHDLELTGGKYLGNQSKFTKLWSEFVDGELEIKATFQSTDDLVISKAKEITAPSIELMVDTDNVIFNDLGEYYIDFDWVGCALLLGVPAGSGDARISGEIKEFDLNLKPINKQIMQEEQVKELLKAQKVELTKEFSTQLETIKAEFGQIVAQSQSKEESVWEYMDEDGNKYRTTSKEVCNSITELVESGEVNDTLMTLMKSKGFEIKKFEIENDTSEEDKPDEENKNEGEETPPEELKTIENSLNQAEELADKMKQFKSEDKVENRDTDVSKSADEPRSYAEFIANL